MSSQGQSPGFWDQVKRAPKWVWVVWVVVVIGGIAALTGEDPEAEKPAKQETTAKVAERPAEAEEPAPDPTADLKAAIEDAPDTVQNPKVKDLILDDSGLVVFLETPEGGFEGPSTRDTSEQARAVFEAAHELGVPRRGRSVVKFVGGLVDSATGNDLPNKLTAEYKLSQAEAKRINWDDEDAVRYTVDWSIYRTFVHPAIKMDDPGGNSGDDAGSDSGDISVPR